MMCERGREKTTGVEGGKAGKETEAGGKEGRKETKV